ncbi:MULTISPECIES: GtrA family protein [Sphingobium]|uniref:GtrA family protein n=1 Tax=Sphingobium TaxID=165695 RepID=UPI0015EB4CAD|nr:MULTISPECIES: GtrA family protein [Sphingobium]MCW2363504.1 putative flippase GtrA [Sphingobium sp. B10D3B]MCW2403097.1 putative flippase GtrA [Sphingobium sp. B10D7B]MCW2410076.1 putative flippase GtrA [Sphingobium xanthum]
MSELLSSAARFGTVGAVNTALSLLIIAAMLAAGCSDLTANVVGYAGGLSFSFFANRVWTFRRTGEAALQEGLRFLFAFAVAYSTNVCILLSLRAAGQFNGIILQIPGMVLYTTVFFIMSRFYVFREEFDFSAAKYAMRSWWPEISICFAGAITAIVLTTIPLTHDVVWQIWIARQIIQGAVLYKDIWELNPPIWFWSAIPIVQFSDIIGVAPRYLLVATVVAMGTASALAIGALGDFGTAPRRCAVMLFCYWFMVPLPLFDFGQREQLALICALPYAALISRRQSGHEVVPCLAVAIGLAASYGFALKHYFLAIPVLLEAWLFLSLRRRWSPVRPETAVLAVMAGLYAAAVIVLAPDFLTRMVPMVRAAYHGYEVPFLLMIDEPAQIVWLIGGLAFVMNRRLADPDKPIDTAFALVAVGFGFAYFVQLKGWQYHALPVTGALLAAVAVRITSQGVWAVPRYPLGAAVIGFAVYIGIAQGPYQNWLERETGALLGSVPKGQPVAVLAADPMFQWPAIERLGLEWPLHLYSYWMLPAIGNVAVHPSDPGLIRSLAATILLQTDRDLRCRPPALILVERMEHSYGVPRRYFNVQSFFASDQSIAAFLRAHYREEAGTRLFAAYRRIGEVPRRCSDFNLSQPMAAKWLR